MPARLFRLWSIWQKKYGIPVILLCDTNHVLQSEYSEVKVIGAGADAVDFALVGLCQKGDLVVTQDYGVAAMILGKGAYGIHQSGKWYTDKNIDRMLMERHISKKVRRSKSGIIRCVFLQQFHGRLTIWEKRIFP